MATGVRIHGISEGRSVSRRAMWHAPTGAGAALLMAACGQASGNAAPKVVNPPLTLEFWHNKAQPEGQDVTGIVARYNNQFAPTVVKESFQGNLATLLPKLRAALAAGTPPDASNGSGRWMPSFADQGALTPADDLIKRLGGIKKEDFYPAVISSQTWKGKLQALPYGTASKGYYYRPDIFSKESVAKMPVTWDEFDQVAARLTRDDRTMLGMSPTDFNWFMLVLSQRGGKVLDDKTGKAAFHQPLGIDALGQITDLAQKKRTLKITSNSSSEFANGTLASIMSGEWQVRFYRADGTVHDTAFFPRPKASDPPLTLLGVEGLYVYKGPPQDRQDTTWRFLTWLLKPDVYHSWAVTGSFRLPMVPAWVKSDDYQKFLKENPQQKPFAEQLANGVMNQPTIWGDELEKAMGEGVRRAVTGEQSPRDSLANAAREFDALVK
jgi:ABC-type glycerol-3-phosphate transport system substrate-binding protein